MKTEVWVERHVFRRNIEFTFVRTDELGQFVAKPLTFERVQLDMQIVDPTMRLRPEDAQLLMDELWRVGLRPTEGTGSAGSLAATERHLKDMQTIAFKLMDRGLAQANIPPSPLFTGK